MIYACSNPAQWHPTLHTINRHHNPPKSYTEDGGATSLIIPLCGICHDEVHTLLNEYVRAAGTPAWEVLKTFSPFIRKLAVYAWDRRPTDRKVPYTIAAS